MLSEEAVILVAVAGALVLVALGVLELIWPTRPRHARGPRAGPAPARPFAAAPPRPTQGILPRRLIDSPSAARPAGGFAFPPPADYVPPPLPREEVWPIRPPEHASPVRPIGVVKPAPPVEDALVIPTPAGLIETPTTPPAPVEPVYIAPPALEIPPPAAEVEPSSVEVEPGAGEESQAIEIEPRMIEVEPWAGEPAPAPVEAEPSVLQPKRQPVEHQTPLVEPEPRPLEPEPTPFEVEPRPEAGPPRFEPEPPPPEPEPRAVEPVLPPLEPEPLAFEPEPPLRLEVEAPMVAARSIIAEVEPKPIEQEPSTAESPSLVVESIAEPLLPATAPVEPESIEPPPVERVPVALPYIEPPAPPIVSIPASLEPGAPPPEPVQPSQSPEPAEPPIRRRRSKISPHARPHRVLRPAKLEHSSIEPPAYNPAMPAPVESPARPPFPSEGATAGIDARITRDSPLVERCFALYQDRCFDEVLAVGEPGLAALRSDAGAGASREAAALWSVVGLAKQALGDDDGAHAALAASIDAASETERPTYRRHLATHALEAAQARLARAASHDPGDRMAVIRTAIAWTERGLAAVPPDPALHEARETAHEALWQAYEQAATALLQRQEFGGARQVLHEALDDPKLPAVRAAGFRGLLSGTFGGEIGQLTAQAILGMQEGRESEALGVLERAEELLAAVPADTLAPSRRDEVDQRLWWGYAELGSRRLDAGGYEEALDPLLHALRFTSIGAERQAETRAAVVRALEGIAAVRALSIRRLAEAGSRDEAIVAAGELNELVKRGLEVGITEDELVAAFARVRRLCEELGMDARA